MDLLIIFLYKGLIPNGWINGWINKCCAPNGWIDSVAENKLVWQIPKVSKEKCQKFLIYLGNLSQQHSFPPLMMIIKQHLSVEWNKT